MKVKIARIKKGITQQQLCKIVKTSPKKLGSIEKGYYDMVTIGLAKKLADALDTTVQELFFSDEE